MPVKQWMTPVNAPLVLLLAEDRDRVVLGIARVHDERQLRDARRRDVVTEIRDLRVARRVFVIVVEPALAEADDLLVLAFLQQHVGTRQRFDRGLVRMNADGAVDIGRALGHGAHAGKPAQARCRW